MSEGLQGTGSVEAEACLRRTWLSPDYGGRPARSLRCKSTEDGDGATGRSSFELDECRMHDSLDCAVAGRPEGGIRDA